MTAITFDNNDFSPLETFSYIWRWTSTTHAMLAADELAQIRPWKKEKINEIWNYVSAYWYELGSYLWNYQGGQPVSIPRTALFADISVRNVSIYSQFALVGQEIRAFESQQNMEVVVIWDTNSAIVTTWSLFCSHWDDFCYPSDDVCIWPLSDVCCLVYSNSNYLVAGKLLPIHERVIYERPQPHEPSPETQAEVLRLLQTWQIKDRIEAIKLYSRETNNGLKASKDVIDSLMRMMNK